MTLSFAGTGTIALVLAGCLLAAAATGAGLIEDSTLAFSVSDQGAWELLDKRTGEVWRSNAESPRFAVATVRDGARSVPLPVTAPLDVHVAGSDLTVAWRPRRPAGMGQMRFSARLMPGGSGVRVRWEQVGGSSKVKDVRFPDSSCRCTKDEVGYLVVPNRMGIIVPAGEKKGETRTYGTYRSYFGLSMAMAGAVKNNSGLMLSWRDPYCSLETRRSKDLSFVELSLLHRGRTGEVTLTPVGRGGYVEIAQAYRGVARDRGLLRTVRDKWPESETPVAGREYLSMQCVYNNPGLDGILIKESERGKTVEATFAQVAATAEHIKRDLGIDSAMMNLWGWGNMGYDRHPDMLPAAPECGGNEGLQDCARRVKALGYLFGLRDNYEDFYDDAPSWDPSLIMRRKDGSLMAGGVWAGARSYLANSRKGFEVARRPQNIPGIKELFDPDFYYIDTTFAAPLYEDFSKDHPLTLSGDLYWKRKLCDYAQEQFGVFGSEEGVEWGVPCADFFESLITARTNPWSEEVQIPLFEMVYGDCVQIYQGDRTTVQTPKAVLDHLLCAEMPVVWLRAFEPDQPWCRVASVRRLGPEAIEITHEWKTYGRAPAGDYGIVFDYVNPEAKDCRQPAFSLVSPPSTPTRSWPVNSTVAQGPLTVTSPELRAPATGEKSLDIYTYMTPSRDGTGGMLRVRGFDFCLSGGSIWGHVRGNVGRLKLASDGGVSFSYPVLPDLYSFGRCDTQRDSSYQNDGLILNTYKICSPLNRLTADTPMTSHRFLSADRAVEQSEFGDVRITVNYGLTPYTLDQTVLPAYGFLVESPQMVSFRATSYGGRNFSEATMVVAVSKDRKPLAESASVDTYRAYGDTLVTIAGRDLRLE